MISLVGIFVVNSIKSITPDTRNITTETALILFWLNMVYNYVLHWIFYKMKNKSYRQFFIDKKGLFICIRNFYFNLQLLSTT